MALRYEDYSDFALQRIRKWRSVGRQLIPLWYAVLGVRHLERRR